MAWAPIPAPRPKECDGNGPRTQSHERNGNLKKAGLRKNMQLKFHTHFTVRLGQTDKREYKLGIESWGVGARVFPELRPLRPPTPCSALTREYKLGRVSWGQQLEVLGIGQVPGVSGTRAS